MFGFSSLASCGQLEMREKIAFSVSLRGPREVGSGYDLVIGRWLLRFDSSPLAELDASLCLPLGNMVGLGHRAGVGNTVAALELVHFGNGIKCRKRYTTGLG